MKPRDHRQLVDYALQWATTVPPVTVECIDNYGYEYESSVNLAAVLGGEVLAQRCEINELNAEVNQLRTQLQVAIADIQDLCLDDDEDEDEDEDRPPEIEHGDDDEPGEEP